MTTDISSDQVPELAAPAPALSQPAIASAVAVVAVAALAAFLWTAASPPSASLVPAAFADLGEGFLTTIDPARTAAVAAAVAALRLPEAQRAVIEQSVLDRERRIAWIVFTDSMDPDGDTVAVEAAGIVQHVVLTKAWTPVAVPLAGGGPIGITGVRDGGGGGITVALATRAGSAAVRTLLPGERIEVAAP